MFSLSIIIISYTGALARINDDYYQRVPGYTNIRICECVSLRVCVCTYKYDLAGGVESGFVYVPVARTLIMSNTIRDAPPPPGQPLVPRCTIL